MHIICTICSDLINPAENIHITTCGHIFHFDCLSKWISRSQSCPQCRTKVTKKCMFRIYPTISNEVSNEDAATLQSKLDNAQLQLREQAVATKEKDESLNAALADVKKKEEVLKATEKKLVTQYSAVVALKEQLEYVKIQNRETQKLKEQNEELKKNMLILTGLQKVLNATCDDVEQMLEGYTDVRTVATFATALKKALCESESKKNEYRDRLTTVKQQLAMEKKMCTDWQAKYRGVKDKLDAAQRQYESLKNKRKASDFLDISFEGQDLNPKRLCEQDVLSCGAVANGHDDSINTMVNKIEQADSPYLSLKHSSLALSALQRPSRPGDRNLKPSEFAMLNSAKNAVKKSGQENLPTNSIKPSLSIFHKKEPIKINLDENKREADLDVSYDGLGGHSKLDVFPVPRKPSVLQSKSIIPKLSSKHKLKRPNTTDNYDIATMLQKIRDK